MTNAEKRKVILAHKFRKDKLQTLGARRFFRQYFLTHHPRKPSKFKRSQVIDLTKDEHAKLWPILTALLKVYRRERRELEKRIAEEACSHRKAFDYTFYEKAGILWPSNGEPSEKDPGFSLEAAIRAAKELDGLVFPDSYIKAEPVAIEGPK